MQYGADHSESFATSRNPNKTKRSTSFLNISLCNFGTGYGREYIDFTYCFNWKSTGSFSQVPSVPLDKFSDFVIILEMHYVVLLSYVGIGFP